MKKIIVVRIYNSSPEYDAMKRFHDEYDNSIYVTYNPNIDTEWKYTDSERLIEVRGEESYTPGILNKTIIAIKVCLQLFDFDFLVRSNISTVVDTEELQIQLDKYSRDEHFYGGHTWPLEMVDGKLQFTTVEWLGRGLPLVTGTGIVFSRKTSQYIVDNEDKMNKDVIDDVSIAMFLEPLEKIHLNIPRSEDVGLIPGVCFYRFRTDDIRPWLAVFTANDGRSVDIQSIEQQYKIMSKRNLLNHNSFTQTPCEGQCALPLVPEPTT